MIINTDKGNIKVLGDIREFKTSIDPKNLGFITTLLSSNLYSDPEQSFIREIVSNAWDSHVEAGTTEFPVIVRFKKIDTCWEITIRDFGTGLSPERFQEVFCNIGSSTKRESNDFIGGFGIGRYSALACSNTVYITSYYNGTAFLYIMAKSGNTITTNLISESSTKEKNGVAVTIKNIYNIVPYRRALKYIIFFPNVYVDGVENDNNTVVFKRFNNFAVASCRTDSRILLGNVLYPCNERMLSEESKDFLTKIWNSGIVIKLDIGSIDITPNREAIIYSNNTIIKINEKIAAIRKELDEIVVKKCNKDYDNLYDLYLAIKNAIGYNLLKDFYSPVSRMYDVEPECYITTVNIDAITFKGTKLTKEYVDVIKNFFGMKLPNIKGVLHEGRLYQTRSLLSLENRTKPSYRQLLCLSNSPRLNLAIKSWLKESYPDYTVITPFTKEEFRDYILDAIPTLRSPSFANREVLIEYMYDYIMSIITTVDTSTDSNFLSYKGNISIEKASNVKKVKDFIIYIQESKYYRNRIYFRDIEHCIEYLKKLKKGIILTDMQGSNKWYEVARARNLIFIKARKDIVKAVESLNPTFLVDKEYIITKDPTIVKLYTILKCLDKDYMPTKYSVQNMLSTVPNTLAKEFLDIINFYYKFEDNDTYTRLAKTKCTDIDGYTESVCNKLLKYRNLYNRACEDTGLLADSMKYLDNVFITAVLIKRRYYRVSYEAYKRVKNNIIIKILCKK